MDPCAGTSSGTTRRERIGAQLREIAAVLAGEVGCALEVANDGPRTIDGRGGRRVSCVGGPNPDQMRERASAHAGLGNEVNLDAVHW